MSAEEFNPFDTELVGSTCQRKECGKLNSRNEFSPFCSNQCAELVTHRFEQMGGIMVNMCVHCGKWPIHHVHGLGNELCTCDSCRKST